MKRDQEARGRTGGDPAGRDRPWRRLNRCAPLLTAAQAYPEMERALLSARRDAWLWFRVFDPDTELVSQEARDAAGRTWRDLFEHRVRDGVTVALAVSDFDAIARTSLHRGTHRAARRLVELTEHEGFHLLVADHGARAGLAWRIAAWPMALIRLEKIRGAINGSDDPEALLRDTPGLHRNFRASEGRAVWRGAPLPELKPASHHQKVAVFDGVRSILGGLDVDPRRWDTQEHERVAEATWRDLSVDIDGPAARDVAREIAALWNRERERLGRDDVARLQPPDEPAADAPPDEAGRIRISVTQSREAPGVFRLRPMTDRVELERDHLAAIAAAERLIFIETQFLRSRRVARALAARAKETPELSLLLVLPAAPQDVAFQGARGLDARFGEHLQAICVNKVRRAFGERAAIVSPARQVRREAADRSAIHGSGIVYVHTKTLVVDDEVALVSSANLNGRSLRWDTEMGVVLEEAATARAIRMLMCRTLLPEGASEDMLEAPEAPTAWRTLAEENISCRPWERRGLIVPYPRRKAERFGAPAPGLPDEMV